jgi:hypothetical protein
MQQTTIQFDGAEQLRRQIDVRATLQRKYSTLSSWLHGRSAIYSRIAEFNITRLTVLRINLVSLCVIAAAIAIEQAPFVAVTSAGIAAWLVYRLNKSQKGGEK